MASYCSYIVVHEGGGYISDLTGNDMVLDWELI